MFWQDLEAGEMVSLGKIPEKVNLYYAYLSTTMYTQVLKQPSFPVRHRECMPERSTAKNIGTSNVKTLNDQTDFKLQNL